VVCNIRFVSTGGVNDLLGRTRSFAHRRAPLMAMIRLVFAFFMKLLAGLFLVQHSEHLFCMLFCLD